MIEQQHPVLSKVPTLLSVGRMAFGAKQIGDLMTTEISDRTWCDATETAIAAITDKADGAIAGQFGSTKHGPLIDRLADITFSVGGELALARRGEINWIHPILSIGREATITAMRQLAAANGQALIPVGRRGQQKTTVKMSMLTVARSPWSRYGEAIESMASVGTTLSLISGMECAGQYFAGKKQLTAAAQDATSSARNGEFRKAAASPNDKVARFIDRKLPWVTPTHLTRLGELLVEGSAAMTLRKPETKWAVALAIGPYTLGGLIDGIDGNLARLKGETTLEGMLKDVRADKRQEIFTASINSVLASRRGNRVAATHYAVAAMTASLPALFRATAESKGSIVNEDSSGSRVVRGIEGGFGLGFNADAGISNTVSSLMAVGNILTAAQRADVSLRGQASPHHRGTNDDPIFRQHAAARRNVLMRTALGGIITGVGLLVHDRYVKSHRRSFYNVY